MDEVETEHQACLDMLDKHNVQSVINRLQNLSYEIRLSVLEKKNKKVWGDEVDTVLCRTIETINSDSYKDNEENTAGNDNNPIKLMLDGIRPVHRLNLLMIGDGLFHETALHTACKA